MSEKAKTLKQVLSKLKRDSRVKQVWLAGSAAADLVPKGDLDLLVVAESEHESDLRRKYYEDPVKVKYKGKVLPLHVSVITTIEHSPDYGILRFPTKSGETTWTPRQLV